VLITDFDYELPEELIAQRPAAERDASRMLVLDRAEATWQDRRFYDLPSELTDRDVLVLNNTRVFPARLIGRREPSGGHVEIFLIGERPSTDEPQVWDALARPARRLSTGQRITFGDGRLRAEVVGAHAGGRRTVRFECDGDFRALVEEFGRMPLPPYIKRAQLEEGGEAARDRERYQTVYAGPGGAVAAPTAGLHFTPRVLESLRARGVTVVELTLHVGYGTFAPVRVDDLSRHAVEPERYEIATEAAEVLNDARASARRVVATGTTTVRALEAATDERGAVRAGAGLASLTITPGYRFKTVGAMLTNFHLPRSSLLVLVCAFAGRELTLSAYQYAARARYRFYSYGDCMFIV
jgi:S-adenosylmethionine:tRNA ribosyltransferase-isomerase